MGVKYSYYQIEGEGRIGSLCTGYGGLYMAIQNIFRGSLAWCADSDRHVSKILATRLPDVPNLGDLTSLDWSKLPPVDVLCAGFPCQDISYASPGPALRIAQGTRSGL